MLVIQVVKESANQVEDHLGVVAATEVVIQDVLAPVIALVKAVVEVVAVAHHAVEDAMVTVINLVEAIVIRHVKVLVCLNQQMDVMVLAMDPAVQPALQHVLLSVTLQ